MPEIVAEQAVAAARRWAASHRSQLHAQRDGRLTLSIEQFGWALADAGLIGEPDTVPADEVMEIISALEQAGLADQFGADHDARARVVFR